MSKPLLISGYTWVDTSVPPLDGEDMKLSEWIELDAQVHFINRDAGSHCVDGRNHRL